MITVRVWFTKVGDSSYISLLDLQRVMQRAFKRAQLPVWYTQGFNPHIYMTFSAPLSLGQESLVESLDFKTEEESLDLDAVKATLIACLPKSLAVQRVEKAQMDPKEIAFARYNVQYDADHAKKAQEAFANYALLEKAPMMKKGKGGKEKEIDLKDSIEVLAADECENGFTAQLLLPAGNTFNVNPMLLLTFLEQTYGLATASGNLLRTELLTKNKEKFV
ncbi:MAG: TIGR03936 family radical SAM-associated protein [Ruthenibacterium sp.]